MGDFQIFIKAVQDGNLKETMNSFHADFLERASNENRRPIHFACKNGHLEVVKFLVQNKCNLECEDKWEQRPIHFACWNGHLEVVKFLVQNKCNLECEEENNWQPIHYACMNGHLEVVMFLGQNKCNLECESEWKQRPIHYACMYGHLEVVKFLLQNKCNIECEEENKQQPIHYACMYGHLEVVKFLLQNKCNLECEDKNKWRPIHFACFSEQLKIVKFLIQSNCEPYCKTEEGQTPMQIAKIYEHKDYGNIFNEIPKNQKIFDCIRKNDAKAFGTMYSSVLFLIDEHQTGLSLLEIALLSNANKVIEYLLNKLVTAQEISMLEDYMENCCRSDAVQLIQECLLYRSIRYHDADGFHLSCLAKTVNEHGKLIKSSFLEMTAEYGCKPFIHVILKKSIYNEDEWTNAKNLAIRKGYVEIAEAITNRKNLLRKRAQKNFTWLHSAVCDNDPDMMKYILDRCLVNPNFNNEVVGTALALAHMMCYEDCIRVLEKFNVDVNTQNKFSQTPLHEAIASDMIDHCSYLISRAEDIDRPGFMGFTGLQCAVMQGCEELCEELVKNGADCVRYIEMLQQSSFNNTALPISKMENAVTLCSKIHQRIYPCFLETLDSDKLKCSDVQSVMTREIFHLAIPEGDPEILLSLFEKSSQAVQQSVIEDLLDHFSSTDNCNDFVKLLNTEIAAPKLFPNGEKLLTNLLKDHNLKYCWAMINSAKNKKCIVSANAFNETPLQIAIESELFDLINPLILNCEEEPDHEFNWDIHLIPLFQKLSKSTNNENDQKLLAAIKAVILRGGDVYQKTYGDLTPIKYCKRYREEIEKFQNSPKPKERNDKNAIPNEHHDKNICIICLDKEVNCVLDCGHTFCMDCGNQLCRCALCNSETTNPKKLYLN